MKEPIYIIGAGAIGKALAVFLKLQHKNPILIRGSVDDHSSYTQTIEVELADNTILAAEIPTCTASHYDRLDGLIVFTNKSYGNRQLAERLKSKTGDSPIVIMQNGLNVEQPFIENGYPNIYRCVLFTSSQAAGPGNIKFKPAKPSRIGTIKGRIDQLTCIVDQLNNDQLQFEAETDIQPVIWTKAIANSVFNSICPLLETDNGIFHRNEDALAIARRIIKEGISVAGSTGVPLQYEKVLDTILHISKTSDGQLISTYQDILNKRRTEIDTLNCAIGDIAITNNINHSAKETILLGELTKLKSIITMQSC